MCSQERKAELLNQIVLNAREVGELVGCSATSSYKWVKEIRNYMQKQHRPLPLGNRVTVKAFKDFCEVEGG